MEARTRDIAELISSGHQKFDGLDDFLSRGKLQTGLHSVMTNNRWFDFFYEDRGAPVTMVTFNAALPASIKTYPVFSARPIAASLNVNFLGFADPAQGGVNGLPTFWHLSTQLVDTLRLVPAVINKLIQGQTEHPLLFFGSSAGGFGALNYSSMFPGSVALVLNPRVNLLHEPKRLPKYFPIAYPGEDRTEVIRKLPHNLAELYAKPQRNDVMYLQNLEDDTYVRHHFAHFKKATLGRDDVRYVTGDWGRGHVVPPREIVMRSFMSLLQAAPKWHTATFPHAFIP